MRKFRPEAAQLGEAGPCYGLYTMVGENGVKLSEAKDKDCLWLELLLRG